MALYINACASQKSHLFVGVGDSRTSFCGLTWARWEIEYKRQTWHVVRHVNGNPPVTCKLCVLKLMGRSRFDMGTPGSGKENLWEILEAD